MIALLRGISGSRSNKWTIGVSPLPFIAFFRNLFRSERRVGARLPTALSPASFDSQYGSHQALIWGVKCIPTPVSSYHDETFLLAFKMISFGLQVDKTTVSKYLFGTVGKVAHRRQLNLDPPASS
jgi:hypothetical protein